MALSQGTKWRVDGLKAAASASKTEVRIPAQPPWSVPFIEAFQSLGPIDAHGAAKAWLGHIDLLRLVVQSRWCSALILEDDADWSMDIREQMPRIAKAVVELSGAAHQRAYPYGQEWDVLWMGHCSDPPDFSKPHVIFEDNTSVPMEQYLGINRHVAELLNEGQRCVHFSQNPVCTWAYAVTAAGARKVLERASLGQGGAFGLMMLHACQDRIFKCVTVNPQIFSPYHPAEGDESEVGAGDSGREFQSKSSNEVMGST